MPTALEDALAAARVRQAAAVQTPPETPEEVIARRRAAIAAGSSTATLESPEDVIRRRRAEIADRGTASPALLEALAVARRRQANALRPPPPGYVPPAEQDRLMEPSPTGAFFRGMGNTAKDSVARVARPFVRPLQQAAQAAAEGGKQMGFKIGELLTGGPDPLRRAAADEEMSRLTPDWIENFLDPYAESMANRAAADAGDPAARAALARERIYAKGGVQGIAQGGAEGLQGALTLAFPGATALFSAPGISEGIEHGTSAIGDVGEVGVRSLGGGEEAQQIGRLGSKGAAVLALALLGKRLPTGAAGRVGAEVLGQAAPIVGMTAGSETARLAELVDAGPGVTELSGAAGGLGGAFGAGVPVGRVLRSAARARAEHGARAEAAESAPQVADILDLLEADRVKLRDARAALADPIGKAAERAPQEAPPPSPEAIRESMDLSAATTRAAEALRRPTRPVQEPIPRAAAQAEGTAFRPGDTALFWDEAGARHYGTVESVSPDGILKVRTPGRRTAIGVPADRADVVNRGPAPVPPKPSAPEPQPRPVVPPRVAEQPPAVQRQPGIAPEEAPGTPPEVLRRLGEPERLAAVRRSADAREEAAAGDVAARRAAAEAEFDRRLASEGADLAAAGQMRNRLLTEEVRRAILTASDRAAAEAVAYGYMRQGYESGGIRNALSDRAAGITPGQEALAAGPIEQPARPSSAYLRSLSEPGEALPSAPPPPAPAVAAPPLPPAPPPPQAPPAAPVLEPSPSAARSRRAKAAPPAPVPAAVLPPPPPGFTVDPVDPMIFRRPDGARIEMAWRESPASKRGPAGPILDVKGYGSTEGRSGLMASMGFSPEHVESGMGKVARIIGEPQAAPASAPAPRPEGAPAPRQGRLPFPGTTLGAGLGGLQAVDWKAPQVQTTLRATAGGGAGYLAALAAEGDDDDPATIASRRVGYSLLGAAAAGGGIPGWQRVRASAARLRRPRLSEEVRAEIRQNVHELRTAKVDATTEANRQVLAKRVFTDPADQFTWNEYLRDSHGSETPFLELIDRIDKSDRALANQLVETAEAWRKFSAGLGDEGVAAGRVSPEARAERPGGHLTRLSSSRAEGGGWFARFRQGMPKLQVEGLAADAWGTKVTLSPEQVRAELKALGLEDPTGKPHHYLKGDESGTLIKWEPTEQGFEQASRFLDRMGELERKASEVRLSPSRIRGGGEPSMVVQVGEGSGGGIGHIASPKWDDVSLRVTAPRSLIREIAAGVGIDPPEIISSGSALRTRFATTAQREAFLQGLREIAVEEATFNVTPQAKRWLADRLRGSRVAVGPGSRGGATGRVIVETFGPRSRESLMQDVQDPVTRAYVTALRGGQRNAQARHLTRIAFGEDARGPWTVDAPQGKKAGERVTVGDQEYVVQESAPELGDLSGRALRKDWADVFATKRATAAEEGGFWRSFVGKIKTGKVSTSAGTVFNNVQNVLFHVNNGTSPWMHPRETLRVGADFLKAFTTGDLATLDRTYGRKVGFHLADFEVLNPAAAEGIRAVMEGARSAEQVSASRRSVAGRVVADVFQQGVLADVGEPGIGRTLKGLGISTGAGAAIGGLSGAVEDDDAGEILLKMLKGGGYGLAAGAAARTGRQTFFGTDPFHRAVAFEVMTTKPGPWGEPLSEAAARDRLHRKFQDFENMDPAIRKLSGQGAGPAAALVNEFTPAYVETLRVMKNAYEDNPALATASLLAVPAVASIVAYAAGTFRSSEEARAARENAAPGAFFRRNKDGSFTAFDVNRMTGADVAVDLAQAVKDPGDADSWRKLLTDFGGSMIGTSAYDTAQAALNPDARDLRFGRPLREPQEGAVPAAVRTAVRGLSSPLSPKYGTTAAMLEDSLEKPYQRGTRSVPARPAMTVVRAVSGLKSQRVDFEDTRIRILRDYEAELEGNSRELSAALRQANTRASKDEILAVIRKARKANEEAGRRKDEKLRDLLPQDAEPAMSGGAAR